MLGIAAWVAMFQSGVDPVVIGVLGLSTGGTLRQWSEHDVEALTSFARLASIGLVASTPPKAAMNADPPTVTSVF